MIAISDIAPNDKTRALMIAISDISHPTMKQVRAPNLNRARNVVVFLDDGMGVSTLTAARIVKAQSRGTGKTPRLGSTSQFPAHQGKNIQQSVPVTEIGHFQSTAINHPNAINHPPELAESVD